MKGRRSSHRIPLSNPLFRVQRGRQETAAVLQADEAAFQDLVKALPVGIYRLHVAPVPPTTAAEWENVYLSTYTIDYVSDQFCRISGLSREAFKASPGLILDRIHPEDRADFAARNAEALAGLLAFRWEGRLVGEGPPRWIKLESSPRVMPDGGSLWTGVLTDITDRRQKSDDFRRVYGLLRQAETIAKVGGWEIDLEAGTLFWSEEVFRIHELDPKAYTPTMENSIQFYAPEWRPVITQALQRAIEAGENFDLDLELLTAKGRHLWVHATSQVFLREGRVVKVQGALRDISEERLAAEALARNHAVLAGIMASAEGPIFSLDRAYRYTSFNQAHAAAMRALYGADITLGSSLLDYQIVPEDCASAKANLDRALAGESFVEEAASGSEERARRYFEVSHTPIRSAGGEVIGVAVMARDTTDRERMEAEIKTLNRDLEHRVELRTHQLEAANQELEAFSYSVSHDLRAPLRTISGFSEALSRDGESVLSAEGLGHLKRIQSGATRMAQLIEDLLQLSRIGRDDFAAIPLDLGALAEQILAKLKEADPERSLVWEVSRPIRVKGDPRLLRVLLENLLGNAWKFTSHTPDARIWVSARPTNGSSMEVTIRDNGAGFVSSQANRLFTPFQRLHKAEEFPGTGIGLAIAKRIVSRHGGWIRAEGAPGQGATLAFALPVTEEPAS